jgi:hypothetical protein
MLAGRVTRNIFDQSKVGLIFTNGSPSGERNTLLGRGFQLQLVPLLGDKNIMLAAWGVYSWNEERAAAATVSVSGQLSQRPLEHPDDVRLLRDALNPGIGYMPRNDVQTGYASVSFQPRPGPGGFLAGLSGSSISMPRPIIMGPGRNLETRMLTLMPLGFQTESGETFRFSLNANRDVLPVDFEVADGVVIPAGPHDYETASAPLATSSRRPVSVSAFYTFGGFYTGRYDDVNVSLDVRSRDMSSWPSTPTSSGDGFRRGTSAKTSISSSSKSFSRPIWV